MKKPRWDAVKKSLDAASRPVNLKPSCGIKALCQRSLVLPEARESIV